MRQIPALVCLVLVVTGAHAQESAMAPRAPEPATDVPPDGKAKLRFAGIFIAGFTVRHLADASCATAPDPKPWFVLDCGMWRCPKPVLLGMPAPPSYSNWNKSPRVREIEIDAGAPLAFKLTGVYTEVLNFQLNGTSTVTHSACNFNVAFIPEPGRMYEASLDARQRVCVLSVTELVRSHGFWDKVPLAAADRNDCRQAPASEHP